MPILRVKENFSDIIERDPYELIHIDEPHQVVRRVSPQYYRAAFVGVLVAFAAAFITFYKATSESKDALAQVHAYFEVKAIDGNGRPVAGATVKNGEDLVGVTDSFGEWRRFLRVTPGQTYRFHLTKNTANGQLVAIKNLAVPMKIPEQRDLELTGSVKMYLSKTTDSLPAKAVREVAAPEADMRTAAAPAPDPAGVLDASQIWFVADGEKSAHLNEVIASLRRRSLELGMRIDPDASLRLRLRVLANEGGRKGQGTSLIKITATRANAANSSQHHEVFSYLRNFQETPYHSARDILWALTVHTKLDMQLVRDGAYWRVDSKQPALWDFSERFLSNDNHQLLFASKKRGARVPVIDANEFPHACPQGAASCRVHTTDISEAAPVFGWQKLQARVVGKLDDQTKIYISGYAVQRLGDDLIGFWGVPSGQSNVTILRGDRVVLRKKITHREGLSIALPSAVISRR